MKLWILRPVDGLDNGDNPWRPWYDKVFGFIVRAESEADARRLADAEAGDENRGSFMGEKIANTDHPWLEEKYSSCVELACDGVSGVVMRDFASA